MRVEQLQRWHLLNLEFHDAPGASAILEKPGYLDGLIANGPAFAGVMDEGVVAAMGMVEQNPGNFRCWVVSDPILTSRYFIAVCKKMRRFMKENPKRRIETVVQAENVCGRRWVENILGFSNPYLMRAFNEHGDAWLYERING